MTPFTTQNTASRRWSQSGVLKSDSFWSCKISPGVDRRFSGAKVDGERETEKFIWVGAFKRTFKPFFANLIISNSVNFGSRYALYNDLLKVLQILLCISSHISTRILFTERRYLYRREVHRVAGMRGCRSLPWIDPAFFNCIPNYWFLTNSIRQPTFRTSSNWSVVHFIQAPH